MTDRRAFYDSRAAFRPRESDRHYHRLLKRYFTHLVPPESRVLEVGCGLGDLLAEVRPSRGVGVDFSSAMIELARHRHPQIEFSVADAADLSLDEEFDYILVSDLVNDLPDVQAVLSRLHRFAHPRTRLVVNFFNYLWHPILNLAERFGAKAPTLPQNWLSTADMKNLLHLAGWEAVKMDTRILWPLYTPLWEPLLNRWLAPWLRHLCLTVILVARPQRYLPMSQPAIVGQASSLPVGAASCRPNDGARMLRQPPDKMSAPHSQQGSLDYRCTVVIPARNEAGNIEAAVQRTPEMGLGTEIIFIEGHSTDDTWDEIRRVAAKYPNREIKILKQRSQGKGGAVREAFAAAAGDLLFILDADLTMPPEQLPQFYGVARSGIAEFVNGVRLVYPMEDAAMPFLNLVVNKLFSLAFSWLLGQSIKDTLCGTKVLFRADYENIARNRSYFGDFDPFGDFDLLFGAAKLNLKIMDLPIRYAARAYGQTNIQRWRHGWLLCRMVLFAARRLKFIE